MTRFYTADDAERAGWDGPDPLADMVPMTDPQLLAAAAVLDAHGRTDLADAVMARYRRPTPVAVDPEPCRLQGCCHVARDQHGALMGHDAPLPPNTDRPMMED